VDFVVNPSKEGDRGARTFANGTAIPTVEQMAPEIA